MLCLTESSSRMTHPLPAWATDILQSLELGAIEIDTVALRRIAETVQEDPPTDALLVGFIAGYAAGMAEGSGMAGFDKAHAASVRFMAKDLTRE